MLAVGLDVHLEELWTAACLTNWPEWQKITFIMFC